MSPSQPLSGYACSGSLDVELLSNHEDPPAMQPPNFWPTLPLYPYQLRSLGWMLARENSEGETLRGGILADAMGFGKTTITLALMDHNRCPSEPCASRSNLIPSRATLVIVPPNLWHQWGQEIGKFLPTGSMSVIAAMDGSQLRCHSVRDMQQADVVIVSYRIFHGRAYAKLKYRLKHFYWHRIIADEFHELVAAAVNLGHPFNEAKHQLSNLESRFRWGLTSTPPLKTFGEVAVTATFFQMQLERTTEACTRFLRDMVRRNTEGLHRPQVVQHKVRLLQTQHERALYLARERVLGQESMGLLDPSSLHQGLEPDKGTRRQTAEQVCEDVLQQRKRCVDQLQSDLSEHCLRVEASVRACRNLIEKQNRVRPSTEWYFTKLRLEKADRLLSDREALAVQEKHCSDGKRGALAMLALCRSDAASQKEIAGDIYLRNVDDSDLSSLLRFLQRACADEQEALSELERHLTELLLFERSMASVETSYPCPICLQDVAPADCCIAPCAHVACTACWDRCLSRDARCPLCRCALQLSQVHPMRRAPSEPPHQPPPLQRLGQHRTVSITLEAHGAFGSKVRGAMTVIAQIEASQAGAKILVFCQSEFLRATMHQAFCSFGVEHVMLEGREAQRTAALRRFESPGGPSVMLLSMEFSPSGLNLTMANHVILVQPTWHGDGDETSVDYEEQAVGRCWRTGQSRTVQVWRLCTVGTVEETVVDRHMATWTQRQARSGIVPMTINHEPDP